MAFDPEIFDTMLYHYYHTALSTSWINFTHALFHSPFGLHDGGFMCLPNMAEMTRDPFSQ